MIQRLKLHFVGSDSRARAELSRLVFRHGHHAEVYSDLAELMDCGPTDGVIVACEDILVFGMDRLLEKLGSAGIWLPVIAATYAPDVDAVVQAIRAGALDYARLPMTEAEFARIVNRITSDAGRHGEDRRRQIEARMKIAALSRREREVLDWLIDGCSNKDIARALDLSPRTVEIHRANMMEKLGASHAAGAVRIRLDAKIDDRAQVQSIAEPEPIIDMRL